MLVLSRKANEAIRIGEEVTVKVLKIKGSTVTLGLQAPDQTQILRMEIAETKTLAREPDDDIPAHTRRVAVPR